MNSSRFSRLIRALMTLLGAGIGAALALLMFRIVRFYNEQAIFYPVTLVLIFSASAIVFAFIFFILSPYLVKLCQEVTTSIEKGLENMSTQQVIGATIGLILGLVVALLITQLFNFMGTSIATTAFSCIVYLVLGTVGINIGRKRGRDLRMELAGLPLKERRHPIRRTQASDGGVAPKILDTSVIIDGRVFDICKTGFLEGEMVIPQFVLAELRHIADSGDALRRNRGRRGLDVLNRIQNELKLPLRVDETDFDDIQEVDVKLLRLSKVMGGIVVTNDYNLNKVAGVTGVKVLNINELANAVKPVVLPGEEMVVQIIKEGKEPGQGVGYLDDGTMIVTDNARRLIGETVEVVVTTVLQTSAGRMIFTRLKGMESGVKAG